MSQTHTFQRSVFFTTETAEATAMMSVGIDFADTTEPATGRRIPPINIEHNAQHPRGQTQYALASATEAGVKADDLRAAWQGRKADIHFDGLLDRAAALLTTKEGQELMAEIRKTFPLALMAYYRGYADNRERLLDLRSNHATRLRRFKRGASGFILISDNVGDETRKRAGLPTRNPNA